MDDVIEQLRSLNEEVPIPLRLPTESEIESVENKLGFQFHPDYKKYLLEASDIVYGVLEPATISAESGHTYLVAMAKEAWKIGVPRDVLPIVEDNGDYYCLDRDGHILFWTYNGFTNEIWENLANWIQEVWIGGN